MPRRNAGLSSRADTRYHLLPKRRMRAGSSVSAVSATATPASVTGAAAIAAPTAGRTQTFTTAATTYQVTGLTAGMQYKARVRARDAAGNWSEYSGVYTFATAVNAAPATVTGAATIGAPGITATSPIPTPATVTGSATIGAPTIRLGASVAPGAITRSAVIASPLAGRQVTYSPAGTTQQATGLSPGLTYHARVRARDAAGNWSDWSAPLQFTTAAAGVAAPATVTGAATIATPATGGTPPTVTAGRARPVARGLGVLLDVTATPPGGQSITGYSWAIQGGAGGTLTNANTATPTYTAPGSGSGLVTVRATVLTSGGGQATADVTVSYHGTVVAAENALTGTPRATWDLSSPNLGGISTLQGFCDGFSADKSGTVNFKIAQSDTAGWSAEVYRLGYYGGDGARSYGTVTPSGGQVTASQSQPAPGDADPNTTQLSADAGNWSTTLTWTPPSWAPSGVYILRLNRTGGGASHVMFVLRDDARHADLMLMPSDSTWNAYNAWGGMGAAMYDGNSLYRGVLVDQYGADCARYVSYNRPFVNRGAADSGRSYGAVEWSTFFTGEYPMMRFLERNGFDVKYYGCIDAAGDAAGTHLIGNGTTRGGVGAAMFVGHNEYWSDNMRAGWEAARDAGVSLFSCAGNEVFWRLVGADNDSSGRPRTWECFKSTIGSRGSTGRAQWTGTWRDPDGAGKGGDNPENRLTGTIFVVNGPDLRSLVVPVAGGYSAQPIWRHTSVASLTTGQSFTSPGQILGFEWDTYGPAGVNTTGANYLAAPHPRTRYCSDATYAVSGLVLTDAGDVYGNGNVTHRLVVYPGGNGGIVFGTGTINWALGVDNANTYQLGNDNTSTVIQQATVNMLVDMGAAPASLMGTLTAPTAVDWYVDATPAGLVGAATIAAPTVQTASSATATPASILRTVTIGDPTESAGARATPAVVAGTATIASPAVRLSATIAPSTIMSAGTIAAPTVAAGNVPTPATVAGAATIGAPGVTAGARPTPATVAGQAVIAAPTVRISVLPAPALIAGSTVASSPTVTTTALAVPAAILRAATIAAPTVASGNVPTPGSVTGAATIGGTATAGARAVPAAILRSAVIGGTATVSTTAAPATVAGATAIGAPGVTTSSVVQPAGITTAATIATPAAGGAALAQPATIARTVVIAAPVTTTGGQATPTVVPAPVTIGAPGIVATSRATPATVTGAAIVGTGIASVSAAITPAGIIAPSVIGAVLFRSTATAAPLTLFGGVTMEPVVIPSNIVEPGHPQVIGLPGPVAAVTGEATTAVVTGHALTGASVT